MANARIAPTMTRIRIEGRFMLEDSERTVDFLGTAMAARSQSTPLSGYRRTEQFRPKDTGNKPAAMFSSANFQCRSAALFLITTRSPVKCHIALPTGARQRSTRRFWEPEPGG